MSGGNEQHLAILIQLNLLIKQFKIKLILYMLGNLFPWLAVLLVIGFSFKFPITLLVIMFFLISFFAVYLRVKSTRYQQVTINALLLHLNRKYPQLQESAHLVNSDENSFSILQTLQKERIVIQIERLFKDEKQFLLPKISYRKNIISTVVALLILLMIYFSHVWLPLLNTSQKTPNEIAGFHQYSQENNQELLLTHSKIIITPPTYTELKIRQQSELNASVISGSIIRWQLTFNRPNDSVFIEFSTGEKLFLSIQNDLSYVVEKKINFTGIYRLGVTLNGIEQMLPEFNTLTVTKDNKAKIRIITPKKTITAIATNAEAIVSTHVQITDDFKVDKVEILASIAKGSGESVKFRDQIFKFDSKDVIDDVEHYYKAWQLKDLKMEPGDELYFTVKAWDNRQPNAQMTRSSTKIIRWLEDEQQAILSDGILIDFMPEYFKSQRQIIIETIDLIDDKAELNSDKFVETSELLGVAQSELKEKYGQYLGDEVDDGGGSHVISHEASEQVSQLSNAEASSGNEHQHSEQENHANDSFKMNEFGSDKSGSSKVINQFGHNHEEADIGIMARQDPKALMKRSIASMWQAELYLMLSQPNKALPFEQEALKYLKMAKKAERIYVKRLGFEPPPVSEKRRYQGELNDILTYQQHQVINLTDSEHKQLSDLFSWLNDEANNPLDFAPLSLTQRQLIVNVKMQFEQLLDTRPALIKYIAIFERILLSNSLELDNCQSCLVDITEKIWQLLPKPIAKPTSLRKPYTDTDILVKKYAEFLSERR